MFDKNFLDEKKHSGSFQQNEEHDAQKVHSIYPPPFQLKSSSAPTSGTKQSKNSSNSVEEPIQKQDDEVTSKITDSGKPLDSSTASKMGSLFGRDFSNVQVHNGPEASSLASSENAAAYTIGNNMVFGSNEYKPNTMEGDALLAHELTHVSQQAGATQLKEDGSASEKHEQEANKAGTSLLTSYLSKGKNAAKSMAGTISSGLQIQRCSKEESERIKQMREILQQIPGGREALRLREEHNVGIEEAAGGGSFFDSGRNIMVIDSAHSPQRAALTFVHEMNHARYHHEGLGADIQDDSREEYVRKMVEEEAEGTVLSIEAKIELEDTDVDTSGLSYPLEAQYRTAYAAAVAALEASTPDASEAEKQRVGREAGKARVIQGFMDGEVETSNTHEPYPDYYGNAWDNEHSS